jgi:hypothetical protein
MAAAPQQFHAGQQTRQPQQGPLYAEPAAVAPAPQPMPVNIAQAGYQQSQAPFTQPDGPPPPGSRYAVMGVGSFFWSSILICIPVIGWFACLLWACGLTRYQNKRNFARAILLLLLIGIIFSAVMYFVLRWMFGMALGAAVESAGGEGGGLIAVRQLLEALLQYVDALIAKGQ